MPEQLTGSGDDKVDAKITERLPSLVWMPNGAGFRFVRSTIHGATLQPVLL
jgi:hypothetical protein